MSYVEITLKAGNIIKADVSEFVLQRNAFGSIVGARWTTPADAERALMHLDIESVSAVVFVHDTSEEPETRSDNA